MPKKVDRDVRRQEIVRTYLRIAGRDGMEAATTRTLARELGVASGALWHYFSGFDEVLHEALKQVFQHTSDRIAGSTTGLTGLRALTGMLYEIIPVSELTEVEAQVVVSFWGRVPSRPDMADIQSQIAQQWRRGFYELLAQAVEHGELARDTPLEVISDLLLALTTGLQVEFVLRTPLAERSRQWRMIHHSLTPWLTQRGRAAGEQDDERGQARWMLTSQ